MGMGKLKARKWCDEATQKRISAGFSWCPLALGRGHRKSAGAAVGLERGCWSWHSDNRGWNTVHAWPSDGSLDSIQGGGVVSHGWCMSFQQCCSVVATIDAEMPAEAGTGRGSLSPLLAFQFPTTASHWQDWRSPLGRESEKWGCRPPAQHHRTEYRGVDLGLGVGRLHDIGTVAELCLSSPSTSCPPSHLPSPNWAQRPFQKMSAAVFWFLFLGPQNIYWSTSSSE